ncbi:MAG TPA: hypothetical protein VEE84_00680, partial [Burkholderiaceae bacterium]|nr:hypothetical protein [Burkholderiaceae bacterium]
MARPTVRAADLVAAVLRAAAPWLDADVAAGRFGLRRVEAGSLAATALVDLPACKTFAVLAGGLVRAGAAGEADAVRAATLAAC